jgi:hypothetical protein
MMTTTTPPKTPPRLPTWRELIEQENEVRKLLRTSTLKPNTIIAGPVVTPIINGDVARVVERPTGGWRIEHWVKGVGWTEAPDGAFDLGDFMPGYTRPVTARDCARLGIPAAEIALIGGNGTAKTLRAARKTP